SRYPWRFNGYSARSCPSSVERTIDRHPRTPWIREEPSNPIVDCFCRVRREVGVVLGEEPPSNYGDRKSAERARARGAVAHSGAGRGGGARRKLARCSDAAGPRTVG